MNASNNLNPVDEAREKFKEIPTELMQEKCFALRDKQVENGQFKEIFLNPLTNQLIDKNNYSDSASYEKFDDVAKHLSTIIPERYPAIGARNGICAVAVKGCFDEKGQMNNEAAQIMNKLDSYTEKDIDGAGIMILLKAGMTIDENSYNISNSNIGLEIFAEGHTEKGIPLSGEALVPGTRIKERSSELKEIMDKYLKKTPQPVQTPPLTITSSQQKTSSKNGMDDFEVLFKAQNAKNGDKFKALLDGDTSAYNGDSSKASMALLCMLAYWCAKDVQQIDRIFRNSKLFRPEWDDKSSDNSNITIGEAMIANACNFIKKVYVPQSGLNRTADELIIHTPDNKSVTLSSFQPEKNSRGIYGWDDIGISRLFSDIYVKECRYVKERKQWFAYNKRIWEPNDFLATEKAKEFVKALVQYAQNLPENTDAESEIKKAYITFAKRLLTRKARENLLKDASSVHPISNCKFDQNPFTLNCLNGTLDLLTGEFHQHNPDDLLSKLANVNYVPGKICERWEKHMDEVTEGDTGLKKFIQKSFGYALTGDTKYECLFILYGNTTRNGKSTTVELILNMLGDYGKTGDPASLAQKLNPNSSGPSEDIAKLAGRRMVNFAEPDKQLVLSSSLVKALTGNDTVTARFLHENSFEYKPAFKIFINTNHLPKVTDLTLFRSNRVKVIPFNHRFVGNNQDPNLKEKLKQPENISGILNWCMEGLKLLQSEGFTEPDSVKEAVAEYTKDSDKVGRFIEECLEENPCEEILSDEAYSVFQNWCRAGGQYAESQTSFKASLESHGIMFKKKRPKDKNKGTNPRNFIMGYSWQMGRQPLYAAYGPLPNVTNHPAF